MTSEQMRIELESFVNRGLKEGWRGWPLKNQHTCCEEFRSFYSSMLAAAGFFGRVQQIPLRQMSLSGRTMWRAIGGRVREPPVN